MNICDEIFMENWPVKCPMGWRVFAVKQLSPGDFYLTDSGVVSESDMFSDAVWPLVEPSVAPPMAPLDADGQPTPNDCLRCDDSCGDVDCPNCDGTGTNQYGMDCVWCDGDGDVCCPDCAGSGLVSDYVIIKQLEVELEDVRCENWALKVRLGMVEAMEEKDNE